VGNWLTNYFFFLRRRLRGPEKISVRAAIDFRHKQLRRRKRLLQAVVAVPWWSPPGPCSRLVLARTAREKNDGLDGGAIGQ
jgi:hypothetical protein